MTSIAVVVLDSLRKDSFDRHFNWLSGMRFEQAYTTSHWTVPTHASLFTGKYPSEINVSAKNLYFDVGNTTLVEELQSADYMTRAYSANPNISGHFNFDRGFDEFHSPMIQEQLNFTDIYDWRKLVREANGPFEYIHGISECLWGEWDTISSIAAAVTVLRNGGFLNVSSAEETLQMVYDTSFGDREFLFINLMECHKPYNLPVAYRSVSPPEMVPTIGDLVFGKFNHNQVRKAYSDAVQYLSSKYREIFKELNDSFDIVITLSDHGEMLGEQDCWGHEYGVYPQITHIPLVISGENQFGTITEPVSIKDVYQTILNLAGIDNDTETHTLLSQPSDRECHTEYHGLTPWSEHRLKSSDYDSELIEKYDKPVFGVAASGSYGYEGLNGFFKNGEFSNSTKLQERVRSIKEDFIRTTEIKTAIPEDLKPQLRYLGYR